MCLQWYNSNNWCVVRWMALLSEIYVFLNLTVWWLLRDIEDSISAFCNEEFIALKIIFIWLVVLASVTRKDSKKECVFTFKVEDFKVKGMLTKEPEEGKFILTSSNARLDTTKHYFDPWKNACLAERRYHLRISYVISLSVYLKTEVA